MQKFLSSERAPRSIQSWLVTVVAVALVPVLAFTLVTVLSLVERERATLASGLQDTARALALAVDQELERSVTTLQGLAASAKLAVEDYPGFYQQLEDARASGRQSWWTAGVLDRSGHVVISLDPSLNARPGAIIRDDELWADRPWISDRWLPPDLQKALVLVAVPINRPRKELQQVLIALVRAESLAANVVRHRLPPGVQAYVLDRRQSTVVRIPPVSPGSAGEFAGTLPPYSAEGFGRFGVERGEEVYAAFARAPLSAWTVTLVVPESAFEAPWRRWLWTMAGGGILLLIVGLGLAALAARRIARPITALSARARALGRGEALPPTRSGIAEVDDVERAIIAAGAARRASEQALSQSALDLEARARQQAAVARLGQRALASKNLQTLLGEAVELLRVTLRAEFCTVLEVPPAGSPLLMRAGVGWSPGGEPLSFEAAGGSHLELVLRTREPLIVEDFAVESRFSDTAPFRARGIVSGLSVVIPGDDRPYGVLSVHTTRGRVFTGDDVNFLRSIANILAEASARDHAEGERAALLVRAQEARVAAENANQAKDEFLAMLSHELRNPLAAITNASRLLEQGGYPGERTAHLGSIVARQSEHLSRMVDDLLDVSRLGSGKIVLRRELVDMAHIVERSVTFFAEAGRTTAHALRVEVEPALVHGDATRLEQIVRNLLDNALKYTPPGGQVTVAVESEEQVMKLLVCDTGVGIAPEILPHVFELFVQARRSLDRAEGGLGLGLTLVRRLVQMHGGTVSASSEGSARGSQFEVRIPLAAREAGASRSSPGPACRGSRRVLVVEDNPDARETLGMLLESWGHQVEQAENGEAALDRASRLRLDLALIDVGLPGMDGYAVAHAIRTIPACAHLRLVALTGYSRQEDRRRAQAAGFDGFLVKPVAPEELMSVLAQPLA